MGAGAIASFLLAGAWFRYELLWVILFMLPVFVISADSASRIGALNPDRGIFTLIRGQISPLLAWLILLIVVPVHLLVTMGQFSVMLAAFRALLKPLPVAGAIQSGSLALDIGLSVALAAATLWLLFSRGYARLERTMTLLMVLMLICFFVVALRGVIEWQAIVQGFIPSLPPDVPIANKQGARIATSSIIAMVGAAIAPAALLGLPYLCADAGNDRQQLDSAFRKAVINLGFIFGAYAILVLVAGAYALYPLPGHASLDDVGQASSVLRGALPGSFSGLGPVVFNIGLFTAAVTTMVVAAQVTVYFMLDTLGLDWRFTQDNRRFRMLLAIFVLAAAVLAPLWAFPALLKVILLMGINVVVIPLVYLVVIWLCNSRAVMQQVRMEPWRNAVLVIGLLASLLLAVHKAPGYFQLLAA